jgi:hypothetical protein
MIRAEEMPVRRWPRPQPGHRRDHVPASPEAPALLPAVPGSPRWYRQADGRYDRAPGGEADGGWRFGRQRHRQHVRPRSPRVVERLHRRRVSRGPRAVDGPRVHHAGRCCGTPGSAVGGSREAARELLPFEALRSGRSQADRRARPLRRRAPMMERPARVRIRNRKPWVLARRRLFGWKVRFTSGLQRSTKVRISQGPTTAQARVEACISEPSSDRSTVRGFVAQGQTGPIDRHHVQLGDARTRYLTSSRRSLVGDTPRTPEKPVDSG